MRHHVIFKSLLIGTFRTATTNSVNAPPIVGGPDECAERPKVAADSTGRCNTLEAARAARVLHRPVESAAALCRCDGTSFQAAAGAAHKQKSTMESESPFFSGQTLVDDRISQRRHDAMGAIATLDVRFFTNASAPLVGGGGRA